MRSCRLAALAAVVVFCFPSSLLAQNIISGSVTADQLSVGDAGYVAAFDSARNLVSETGTDIDGSWSLNLPDGDYWLYAASHGTFQQYVAEMHDGTQCPSQQCGDWSDDTSPEYITPISVAGGAGATVDFVLDAGFTISGTVTDLDNGLPVEGPGVCVHLTTGPWTGACGGTDADGNYTTSALPPGSDYVAYVLPEEQGFQRQVWNGIDCPSNQCDFSAGTTITLGPDAMGIDFSVTALNPVTGTISVFDGATTAPLVNEGEVQVFDTAGNFLISAAVDASGFWSANLADGDYFFWFLPYVPGSYDGYVAEFHEGTPCAGLQCFASNPWSSVAPLSISADTTGIDVTLEQGAVFFGQATDENSGAPIPNLRVLFYPDTEIVNQTYRQEYFLRTDASGNFQTPPLPAKGYTLFSTGYDLGYSREYWQDRKCAPLDCDEAIANRRIEVPVPVESLDVSFGLVRRVNLAGTVRDPGGNPIEGAAVTVYDASGQAVETVWTGPDGGYVSDLFQNGQSRGHAGGFYLVTVRGEDFGLVSQIYGDPANADSNLDCPFEACVTSAPVTPLSTLDGQDRGNIDFQLNAQQFATVTGSVQNPDGVSPGGAVAFIDPFGNFYRDAWLQDEQGNFSIDLPDGSYTAVTRYTYGVIDDQWDGLDGSPCPNLICDFDAGTPIVVSGGLAISGINFELEYIPGGGDFITGSVRGGGLNPLVDTGLVLRNSEGTYLGEFRTDKNGNFRSNPLAADNYYLHTKAEETGLATELWSGGEPNYVCTQASECDDPAVIITNGTLIANGSSGIDFVLDSPDPAFAISGQVTGDGLPLSNTGIELFDEFGNWWGGRETDRDGRYFFYGLEADGRTYRVRVNGPPRGYDFELYDDLACPANGCDPATGAAVTIGSSGIDLELPYVGTAPRFFGRVINTDSGQGVSSSIAYMGVQLWDAAGNHLGSTSTDASGRYQFILPEDFGVGAGDYYLVTEQDQAYHGLVNEANDGIQCFSDCNPLNLGVTPVNIGADESVQVDFFLEPALKIRGRVVDAVSGEPIEGVQVDAWDASGSYVASGNTDANGDYVIALPGSGDHYLFTPVYGIPRPYLPEVWDGATGAYCDFQVCNVLTTGTPVNVPGADVSGIDFDLDTGFTISGTITAGGTPLDGVGVCVHRTTGEWTGACGGTDADGNYTTSALPAGADYAAYAIPDGQPYQYQLWNGKDCPNNQCDFALGDPIELGAPGDATGVDFALTALPAISGTVFVDDGSTVSPATGEIRALVLTPDLGFVAATDIAPDGSWSLNVAPGDYLIAATPYTPGTYQQYVAEFTDGTRVAYNSESNLFSLVILSDTTTIAPFTVGGETTGIDITLEQGVTIEGSLSDENTAALLAGGVVTANTPAFDLELSYGFVRPDGSYTVAAFPAEDFKLFHSGFGVGYGREIGGTVKCLRDGPGGCDDAIAAAVTESPVIGEAFNFDLDLVRRIELSGAVLDAGGNPLGGARVSLRVAQDGYVAAEAWTDGNGFWAVGNIAPGSYYVTVRGEDFGQVGQVYNAGGSVDCPFESCDYAADGTLVENFDGLDKSNIDFQLNAQQFATVTGSVVNPDGVSPGGAVAFIDPFGNFYQDAWLQDEQGNFSIDLPDGSYTAVTRYTFGVIDDQWDGVGGSPCPNLICDFGAGTPITVSGGVASGNPHFVLDFIPDGGYRIRGNVSDSGLNPQVDAGIVLRNSEGSYLGEFRTDRNGNFVSNPLADDNYYLHTKAEALGLARELWSGGEPNYVCSPAWACDDPSVVTTNGLPVNIAGTDIGGIDFVLGSPDPAAAISGQVRDPSGLALGQVGVELFDEFGNYFGGRETDRDGNYFFYGLEADGRTYRVRVNGPPPGYEVTVYAAAPCPGNNCDPVAIGTPVAVGSTGVDIELPYVGGTRIFGRVVRDDSGEAVSSNRGFMGVQLFDEAFNLVNNVGTNSSGFYQYILPDYGLAAGVNYYLVTNHDQGYHGLVNEDNNGTPCFTDCNPQTLGTTPEIPSEGESLRVDFNLGVATGIRGRVTDAVSAAPLQGVQLDAWNSSGEYVGSSSTDADGNYFLATPGDGDYYLFTPPYGVPAPYLPDVWDGTDGTVCNFFVCDILTTGTAINVTGADTTGIDLTLNTGFTISGTISAAGGGLLEGVNVCIHLTTGEWTGVCTNLSGADGSYVSWALPPGSDYVAYVLPEEQGFQRQMYDGIDCPFNNCDFSTGTPIELGNPGDATGVDFGLSIAATLSGVITAADYGPGPVGPGEARMRLLDSAGNFVAQASTGENGEWSIGGLNAGNYYLLAMPPFGDFIDELYSDGGNVHCPRLSCNRPDLLVTVVDGVSQSGLDVELDRGSRITGWLGADGAPLESDLFIYAANGSYAGYGRSGPDGSWASASGFPAGDFYVASRWDGNPDTNATYFPLAWNNRPCGDPCNPLLGDAINLSGEPAASVGGIDFNLVDNGGGTLNILAGTIVDSVTGLPIAGVQLDLQDAAGNYVTSSGSDDGGGFVFSGLADGSYYLFMPPYGTPAPYLPDVWDGVDGTVCNFYACDLQATGITIAVSGGYVAGIDFELESGSSISGVITDSFDGSFVVGAEVRLYDSQCNLVSSRWTDADGGYSLTGFTEGVYFVFADAGDVGYVRELYPDLKRFDACFPDITEAQAIALGTGEQRSGIDLDLDAGALISGLISGPAGALPFNQGQVRLYAADGAQLLVQNNTELFGSDYGYLIGGVLPGTYYVVLSSRNQGLVDELYDDVPCPRFSCGPQPGVPIVVAPGDTVTGVDAALEAGSVISGTLSDAASGEPLPYYSIAFYDEAGAYASFAFSDASGNYSTATALPAGNYFASNQFRVVDQYDTVQGGYLPMVWPNRTCGEPCDFLLGDPIGVDGAAPVTGIDFAMEAGSLISGRVTTDAGATPLANVTMRLLSGNDGSVIRSFVTDASGDYAFPGLGSGDYFVRTSNTLGYGDQLYSGNSCNPFCDPLSGTPLLLAASSTIGGIDFDLTLTPTISGAVRNEAGSAVGGVRVEAYDTLGGLVATATTDAAGAFTLRNLYAGSFYVVTANNAGYVDALYAGAACLPGCDPTAGTAVTVSDGSPATGIDLLLGDASEIAGTVSAAGGPISGVTVEVYRDTGAFVRSALTGGGGNYSIGGLAAGNYHVVSRNAFGYIDEGAGGEVCQATCQPTSTTAVTVGLNTTADVDFLLDLGGVISGQVTDTASGPLQSVTVKAYNAAGVQIGSSTTGPGGSYSIGGLAGGFVYLRTSNDLGYRNQRYDGLACDALCDVLAGTAVVATPGFTATADFALALGGSIAGTVSNTLASGISGVQVQVFDSAGLLAGFDVTGADGGWSVTGLDDGDYRVRTVNSAGYVDEVRGGDSCSPEPCSIFSGAVTTVASSNEVGVDLTLSLGDQISGIATDDGGVPLPSGAAAVYSATGQLVKQGGIFSGSFLVNGLANGRYYMLVTNGSGLVDQLWQNLPCPGGSCDVTTGVPIDLAGAEAPQALAFLQSASVRVSKMQAEGDGARLDFSLVRGTKMSGSVKNEAGEPLRFVTVYFFDADGDVAGEAVTDGLGNFVSPTSFPDGAYFAATSAPGRGGVGGGYIDEIFDGVACSGECNPAADTSGTQIGIGVVGAAADQVHFVLGAGRTISGKVTVVESGADLPSATVQLYAASGEAAGSKVTDGLGNYRFEGLIPGIYFALASHPSGDYSSVLFDGVDCTDGCDVTLEGTPISLADADIGTVNFALSDGSCPFLPEQGYPDSDGDGISDACEVNPPDVDPGAILGDGVRIGDGSTIKKGVQIGDDVLVGADVLIDREAAIGANCTIGDRVSIGRGARVAVGELPAGQEPGCVLDDDVVVDAGVEIGFNVYVGERSVIERNARIGDNVAIGADVVVGRDAKIDAGIIICDGATIKKGQVVKQWPDC